MTEAMVVWRRTVLAGGVLGALLLAALVAAGPADARRQLPTTSVGVGAREYRLAAYRTSVPRGTVRFNLANYGEDGHDLVVRTLGGHELARTGEVRAGRRVTLQLPLAPGTYRLICDLADHEARGMRTTLKVTR
ncbi:MAG TPA: cupredoxin domain-containing protein [Conexibacter sp.]|nr:cupredoxin domain-containing protein [Conexibacter sp.]